ncbi:Putative uncharacterized protein [Cardinium endosymbiont cEper1 of Encarsia pergandiella]|uniref:hypothetical protein n=1 Tax=Cardinium endosymbiont of Encarsia pergandiella TaxID=249402 RepID=UPI00027E9AFA|nr:hypothetical protein [Cardinium endosymbiont of Encarsia pergandiella]CCM09968.1 Putative uncharacterized protein [Cardinium endosymbiont cEper1 of Encarsia pergandiella]
MKNSWLSSPHGQGMALSAALHLFLLGLAYSIRHTSVPRYPNRQVYKVALQSRYTVAKDHSVEHYKPQVSMKAIDVPVRKTNNISKNQIKNKNICPKQVSQKQPNGVVQKTIPHHKTAQIDTRGLYHTGNPIQAGAMLELKGWEWDVVPNPRDKTEECGKIVFEIKVDQDGEIISIQTIEKTVTPIVEKIYADALLGLTFSKTAQTPSGISTGKVTFVLVAK